MLTPNVFNGITIKRFFILAISLLWSAPTIFAQNSIILTFTGRDQHNAYVQMEKVTIQNLTRNWSEDIFSPDTVYTLTLGTSIGDYNDNNEMLLMPNPFDGKTQLNLYSAKNEYAKLSIVDVMGKKCVEYGVNLSQGDNYFEVSLIIPQTYILTVWTSDGTHSIKMINTGHAGLNQITCSSGEGSKTNLKLKSTQSNVFVLGDEMCYTGYCQQSGGLLASATVTHNQYENEDIVLSFTTCEEPQLIITGDTSILYGEGTTLSVTGAENYVWNTGDTTSTIVVTPVTNTIYTVIGTNENNCSDSASITIFVHPSPPSVLTASVTGVSYTSALCGGNVTFEGSSVTTARGVCWSTLQNPTISDSLTIDSCGLGNFTSQITGLQPDTRYYVRAYATNSEGTSYGGQRPFSTPQATPLVYINNVTNISFTSATCVCNVNSEGISPVTARGVCWSTSQYPTINDNLNIDSCGLGSFTSQITGLQPNTRYYVRAYATNSAGTAYGSMRNFTTLIAIPSVTTNSVSAISDTTATCSGNVTSEGISPVIARGVCWSTSPDPTLNNSFTVDSNGLGSFNSLITGLQPNTHYFVRAYATNSEGTAYGTQQSLYTLNTHDGQACSASPTITDYDGNIYNTVQIGQQCWIKENLRTRHYANGDSILLGSSSSDNVGYCYFPNNDSSNVSIYGYLYNWKAVMGNSSSSATNPSGIQGICPDNWHVPSDAEWTQLTTYVSNQSQYVCGDNNTYIARALADTINWNTSSNTCSVGLELSSNNATGFSVLPAGYHAFGGYHDFGSYAYFWSVTECYYFDTYSRSLRHNYAYVNRNATSRSGGLSVRCIRD